MTTYPMMNETLIDLLTSAEEIMHDRGAYLAEGRIVSDGGDRSSVVVYDKKSPFVTTQIMLVNLQSRVREIMMEAKPGTYRVAVELTIADGVDPNGWKLVDEHDC